MILRFDSHKIIVKSVNIMHEVPTDEYIRSDDDIEADANRKLARLLKGARVHPIGVTATDFREYPISCCAICGTGEKQRFYDLRKDHAVCLACGRATKYFQRAIDATIGDMESQMRYWRNYRLSLLRFKRKVRGKGNRGPRLNAEKSGAVMDAIQNGIA